MDSTSSTPKSEPAVIGDDPPVTGDDASIVSLVAAPPLPDEDSTVSVGDVAGEFFSALQALAGMLYEEETLESTLARIARLTVEVIPACDEGTLAAIDDGEVTVRFSTGETSQTIDDRQFSTGVGPCLDAIRSRHPIRVVAMPNEENWPEFVSFAADNGVTSTLSLPLEVADRAIGILNLYSMGMHFEENDEGIGRAFAREAAVCIANARAMERSRNLVAHLERALETRDLIGQAIGVTMVQTNSDAEGAFELLRQASQRENRKLHEIAQRVVDTASNDGSHLGLAKSRNDLV
ncbi:hypothetical protein BH23ACT5_BH23ACT5_08330 [soil metagenome]